MCLMLIGTADPEERDRLEQAAREASAVGLKVTVEHPPKPPWARETAARATISERGGCACSLLSDDADWNAKFGLCDRRYSTDSLKRCRVSLRKARDV
jgi:hypothetical protein